MEFVIDAKSDVGLVRTNNEDMILIGKDFVRDSSYHAEVEIDRDSMYCVALADGMGGHSGGEKASQMVLEDLAATINLKWKYMKPGRFHEAAVVWMSHIHDKVTQAGIDEGSDRPMGTTLVALLVNHGDIYWVNCGDSRIYQMRNGQMWQLSTDHSYDMFGLGIHSGLLTNCIGGGCPAAYIDMLEFSSEIFEGDRFLLCSDGLTDMLMDEEIEEILAAGGGAKELCAAANDKGGRDNVSACVIDVKKR